MREINRAGIATGRQLPRLVRTERGHFVLARAHHDAGSSATHWPTGGGARLFGRFAATRHRAGWRHERTGGDGHADVTAIGRFGTPEGRVQPPAVSSMPWTRPAPLTSRSST
jgi:hypothetical protein